MPLIFILLLPFFELWLLITIGAEIGALTAIALLILAGIVGMWLLRVQGFSTLLKINQKLAYGEDASIEALEGLMLALSGALFLFPGFLSDIAAIIFVIPFSRRLIAKRWLARSIQVNSMHFRANQPFGQENIYEGEFREVRPEDKRLR